MVRTLFLWIDGCQNTKGESIGRVGLVGIELGAKGPGVESPQRGVRAGRLNRVGSRGVEVFTRFIMVSTTHLMCFLQ